MQTCNLGGIFQYCTNKFDSIASVSLPKFTRFVSHVKNDVQIHEKVTFFEVTGVSFFNLEQKYCFWSWSHTVLTGSDFLISFKIIPHMMKYWIPQIHIKFPYNPPPRFSLTPNLILKLTQLPKIEILNAVVWETMLWNSHVTWLMWLVSMHRRLKWVCHYRRTTSKCYIHILKSFFQCVDTQDQMLYEC